MTYSAVTLPLTGAGDATAVVAVDNIGGNVYQAMKLVDGLEGSTEVIRALSSAPNSTDMGLVVRNIPGATQPISGTVNVSSGSIGLSSAVDLSSVGSTRVVGTVNLTSGSVLGPSTATIGAVDLTSAGSTKVVGTVNLTSGSVLGPSTAAIGLISSGTQTIGTVDLSSAGSTKVVGSVNLTSGSVLGPSTAAIGQISSGTQTIGSVQLTSAGTTGSIGSVALLSGSTANALGSVAILAGSTANTLGAVAQGSPAASSADAWWVRSVTTGSAGAGSTTVDANLSSAGSTKIAGLWGDIPFTAGAITSVNSSADAVCLALNAARKGAIIQNGSTGTALLVRLSTVAVSSASPYNFQIPANGYGMIGGNGGFPLYTGAIRCKMNSTAVAGPVFVTEFTS